NYKNKFISAMEDDLNTADAISAIFEAVRFANSLKAPSKEDLELVKSTILELGNVLGILKNTKKGSLDEEIEALIAERTEARKNKDWALADKIRDDLKARGIVLEDTPDGVKWKIEK
ncbi:MAG: cysteine--tRNA ligase, partial [Clostridia bacterium]|nr:cysteine--tRNA ligase [Clostridia bacterium]